MLIWKIAILINSLMGKVKRLTVIAFCVLFSAYIQAEEESLNTNTEVQESKPSSIYSFKDNSSGTLLTNQKSKYSHLSIDKKTYYPDSDIHAYAESKKSSWHISCKKKKFDNMKICHISQGDLWVFLINGRYSVDVGSNHYPRTKGGLRIDNGSAVYGYEGDMPNPLSIIEKLKKGKVAYTRYQEWPYQYDKDGEVSLIGFTEQFNEMLRQYKNL